MAIQRDRGLTYDAELLLKQSHTVQYRQWIQRYRRVRHIVYDFLDHPSSNFTVGSVLYHISAFLAVLIAVILGASTDSLEDHQWMITIYSALETTLAVFFLLEFLVRMWAISADAKYMGFKGHLRYLRKFVCITDIIIIIVTFVILIVDKRYVSDKTMDYLRFIQILRLFHIDRQMTTWRLIRNMVSISRRELTSAYYITFVLFVLLANLVYYTEHFETEPYSFFLENSTASKTQIPTLAHAWWFSAVTITTIGYGDIVPQFWFSKVIVCVLGFLAYCTFVTASTQISVGLTLMMEEDNKNEYKKRLKHASASLIQNWWRYHMASALMKDSRYRTTFFKDCCYKLYLTAETISKMRFFEKKTKERRDRKRRHQKMSQIEWKSPLRLGATQIALQPTGLPVGTTMKRLSQPHLSRHMSLPAQDLNSAGARPRTMVHQTTVEDMSQFYSMKQASIDTNNSFSFDGSDSDHSYPLHEEPSINSLSAVDEKLLLKYKPLLRFIFFLVFQILMKKFQRLKKADKLLEMEAEIVEQIHERDQKLNELEMEFTKITGKPSVSMLDPKGDKLSLLSRVDLCEQKVSELGKRADVMNDLANIILRLVQDPPPDGTLPNLPPAPPGRVPKRSSLQRQSRTTFLEEDELV